MNEQFTPGPWIVCAGPDPKNKTIVAGSTQNGALICRTSSEGWADGDQPDFANANLIASSPDMYKAISNFLNYGDSRIVRDEMKAALSKATNL
jgi:hypothetical protein